jgi:hypothetical protein
MEPDLINAFINDVDRLSETIRQLSELMDTPEGRLQVFSQLLNATLNNPAKRDTN